MNLGGITSLIGRYKWGTFSGTVMGAYLAGMTFATETLAHFVPALGSHAAGQAIGVTAAIAAGITFFVHPQKTDGSGNYLAPNNPSVPSLPAGAQLAMSNGIQLVTADQLAEAQRAKEAAEAAASTALAQLAELQGKIGALAGGGQPVAMSTPAEVGE